MITNILIQQVVLSHTYLAWGYSWDIKIDQHYDIGVYANGVYCIPVNLQSSIGGIFEDVFRSEDEPK